MIEEFLKQEYDNLTSRYSQVVSIFIDYFGEDRVDAVDMTAFEEFVERINKLKLRNLVGDLNYNYVLSDLANNLLSENVDIKLINTGESFKEFFITCRRKIYESFSQDFSIVVYFDKVDVTNEDNHFTTIYDTFIKTFVVNSGKMAGGPYFTRSTYTLKQWRADYLHSHVSGINMNIGEFQDCCKGNGPIRDICNSLYETFDLDYWRSYCYELNRYIGTESISGGPYRHLHTINGSNSVNKLDLYPRNDYYLHLDNLSGGSTVRRSDEFINTKFMLSKFIEWFLQQNLLKFNYIYDSYGIAMSHTEFTTLLSNKFIEWYNTVYLYEPSPIPMRVLSKYIFIQAEYKNYGFYALEENGMRNTVNPATKIGNNVINFKGKMFTLQVITDDETQTSNINILKPTITTMILNRIVEAININYGKSARITKARVV